MPTGANQYQVVLAATIQKITQAQLNAAVAGLKLNIPANITGVSGGTGGTGAGGGGSGGASMGGAVASSAAVSQNTLNASQNAAILANKYESIKTTLDKNAKLTENISGLTNNVTSGTIKYANSLTQATTETIKMVDAKGKITKEEGKAVDFLTTNKKVTNELERANDNILSTLSNNAKKVAEWAISTALIYGSLQEIRKAMEYIVSLNKEMTNIRMVTGMSSEEVGQLATEYNSLAGEMGATTLEVAKGSTEWFRQGKTVAEVSELMKSTLMMSKLGNMESAQATEYLTSTLNGFNLKASESVGIIDKLVALDNNYATSVAEIASALQRSANSAQQAGVTFDELASYITVVSSVTRKSAIDKFGALWYK